MDSSNTRADEDEKPHRVLRNLLFSEGRERAQAAKAAAEQSKHTKKRNASRSSRREALETEVDPYKNLFASDSDEKEEEGAVNEPQEISNDLDRQQENFQAAQRVTTARLLAKEERHTREGIGLQSLAPVLSSTWSSSLLLVGSLEGTPPRVRASHTAPNSSKGIHDSAQEAREPGWPPSRSVYPWVCPENCQSWGAADLLFWKWRDLRIEFVHLVSKRLLPKDFQKREASSAQGERGYELYASAPIPRSGKKARTTHEATAASVPRSRQPSGSQPGAAQSAPTSSVSRGIPATSSGAGAFHQGAARGRPAPRGSGSLHYDRGEVEEPSFDFEYEAPPVGRSSRSIGPLATVTQPQNAEVDRLRQRVLVLEIALGLGTGGDAAAQAGNRGVLANLEDRLHQLGREISGLHDRVGRRAPSSDVDEAFRQLQQVRGALRDLAPWTETHSYGYAQPYSQPYDYGGYSAYPAGAQPYGAPPAYQTPRGPPMPRGF
ncbi:hypothetical protein PC123_g24633 [Phytophthora cactorum]|nr:hypothetical protein PC123_g24633 [Phytophthora cactorum]